MPNKFEKATPRPWLRDDEDIYGADGKLIARLAYECNKGSLLTQEDRDAGDLLVAAVNSYDAHWELVEAASRLATSVLRSWQNQLSTGGPHWDDYRNMQAQAALLRAKLAAVEAAERRTN